MFKVGDKVRCIVDRIGSITKGQELVINSIEYPDDTLGYYLVFYQKSQRYDAEAFELVKKGVEYREGDIVHIRARVNHGGVAQIMRSDRTNGHFTINLKEFPPVHVEPRPLSVSDTVRVKGNSLNLDYKILSIVDGSAWIKSETDVQGSIVSINELKRID